MKSVRKYSVLFWRLTGQPSDRIVVTVKADRPSRAMLKAQAKCCRLRKVGRRWRGYFSDRRPVFADVELLRRKTQRRELQETKS